MRICYFVDYRGDRHISGPFIDDYRARRVPLLAKLPGMRGLELFIRDDAEDPLLKEDAGPVLMPRLTFESTDDLRTALESETWRAAQSDRDDLPRPGAPATYQAMSYETFAVPAPREDAPFSYMVQYHRPAPDEATFIGHYQAHHVPLLADLPGIRRLAVCTPVEWEGGPPAKRNDMMLVNEVAFDSAEALTAALRSEARYKLREDFDRFPRFDGPVTHTPMRREVFLAP